MIRLVSTIASPAHRVLLPTTYEQLCDRLDTRQATVQIVLDTHCYHSFKTHNSFLFMFLQMWPPADGAIGALDLICLPIQKVTIKYLAQHYPASFFMSVTPSRRSHDSEKCTSSPTSTVEQTIGPFPEGGRQAWLCVFGVWLSQFSTFGYTNSYGVYNDYYVREFMADKYTSSEMSWVGSIQLMLVMTVGLISGRLYDVGYFYHLMIGGALLFIFSLFMLSLAQPGQYYQVLLAQGIGGGLGIGFMYVPGIAVVSHYFHRRRAFAMGLVASGSGLGGAIQPIMLNKLFHGSVGFANGVRASAAFNFGILVIAISLMRTRLPPSPPKEGSLVAHLRQFFREPAYTSTVLGTFFTLAGLYFPLFFLQLNAVKRGIDEDLAFYVLTVMNGATVIGRILGTVFVPQLGVFNVAITCVSICAILIFCTIVVKTVATTFMFAVLYGIFCGAYVGIFAPMVGSLAKTDAEIGARWGFASLLLVSVVS